MERETNYWKRTGSAWWTRRRFLGATGAGMAALATTAMIGCGDDDDGDQDANGGGDTDDQPTPAPTAVAKPKRGGTFVSTAFTGDPPSLDPYGHLSFLSQYIGVHSYGRLLNFVTGPGKVPLADVEGDLAEKYEAADQGQTFIFKLRSNVVFHQKAPLNGRALDTQDVISSFERFRAGSPNSAALAVVDTIQATDNSTIVFKLKRPFAPFIELAASPNTLWIMSKEANSGQIDPKKAEGVVGTGPWMLTDYRPSVEIKFAANQQYYKSLNGERIPFLAGLQYLIISEYAQELSQFVAGRTSWFTPRNADIKSVRKDRQGAVEMPGRPGWLWSGHRFNYVADDGFFKDERLRKAVSMALDRDGLIDAFGELGKLKAEGVAVESGWSTTLVPWGDGGMFWWLDPKSKEFGAGAQGYAYNVSEAKKLLSAAAYNGQKIDFNFVVGRYGTTYDQFTEAQIPMLRDIGLNINPKPWEYAQMIGSEQSRRFPGIFYNYQTPFSTIDEYAYNFFHSESGPRGYPNHQVTTPEIVALVDKQRVAFDANERQKIIHDIQRRSSEIMAHAPTVMSRWGQIQFAQPNVRNMSDYRTAGYGFGSEQLPYVWFDQ